MISILTGLEPLPPLLESDGFSQGVLSFLWLLFVLPPLLPSEDFTWMGKYDKVAGDVK